NEVEQLFSVMRQLRDEGVAILFVSHFLEQVYAISDRLTVLRNGQFVGEYATGELDQASLIGKMIGKEITALRSLDSQSAARGHRQDAETVYLARGLGRKGSIEPFDIELKRGEVVGLAGLLGS